MHTILIVLVSLAATFSVVVSKDPECTGYDHPDYGYSGQCVATSECSGDKYISNLCPSYPNDVKCCFIVASKDPECTGYDHPDYGFSGRCLATSDCPGDKYISNLCLNYANDVSCCFTVGSDEECVTSNHPTHGQVGHCIDKDQCPFDNFISNLCPTAPKDIKCCFSKPDNSAPLGSKQRMCGMRPVIPLTRIFNGRNAPSGTWPWIGRLVPRPVNFECMVVLIDEQWALAEFTCAQLFKDVKVVFGDNKIDGSSPNRQEVGIRRIVTHPDYIALNQHQLGLLQLTVPVNITDYVQPVCLSNITNEWEVYDNCWIAGWGALNANADISPYLQEAQSGVLSADECQKSLEEIGSTYHSTQICAVEGINGEPRACQDDIGSPLMCYGEDSKWELVGLFEAYNGQCGNSSTYYTRISTQLEFVNEHIQRLEACSDPDMLCSDGITCVFVEELCDGRVVCEDGSDEVNCPGSVCSNTTCANGGLCQESDGGRYVCDCVDGWEGTNCDTVDCGMTDIQLITGTPVNLTSPSYPNNYPLQTNCEYTITAPDGYKVLVEFLDFDVEFGWDDFFIGDRLITGTEPPSNVTSANESLAIRFISDEVYSLKGYLLQISAIDVTGVNECDWNPCQFNGTCFDEDDGYTCACVDERFGRDCFTPDDHCRAQHIILQVGAALNMSSFYYHIGGNIYGAQYSCKYNVVAPEGHHVRVDFIDVNLGFPWDTLILNKVVYDDLDYYISDDNTLEIVFRTVGSPGFDGYDFVLSDFVGIDGDECGSAPCQNGGICYDVVNGFTCKCRRGYTGSICQQRNGASPCRRNFALCNNGRCIKATNVCDGRNHCGDGSDELSCTCDFQCYNNNCIPTRLVCDNNNNCGDWTDELGCN